MKLRIASLLSLVPILLLMSSLASLAQNGGETTPPKGLFAAAETGAAADRPAVLEQSPLLCAITEVVECRALGRCQELAPADVGLPDFLKIDLKTRKLFEATSVSLRESRFTTSTVVEGAVILNGLASLRGWSAVLSEDNTRLTASVSDEQAGFVVFGVCRVEP